MELNSPQIQRFELLETVLREFYGKRVPESGVSSAATDTNGIGKGSPSFFTVDLSETLTWLHDSGLPQSLDRDVCNVPVLLFAANFSTDHLLLHYDGTSESSELIKNFIKLFGNLIRQSKATIISPSFIPKSKIREEQEIIEMVVSLTKETSFIKLNFANLEEFYSYGIDHNCTLLITTKNHETDLAKILFQYSRIGRRFSVVLPIESASIEKIK